MKKYLILLLLLCVPMLLFCGCGAPADDTQTGDVTVNEEQNNEENNEENNVNADEQNDMVYVTLDAYGMSGGFLSLTVAGEEGVESVAYSFDGQLGETVQSMLERNEITAVNAYLEGDVLEGWMVFEAIPTEDADGFVEYIYELRSGDTIYSTEELLALTIPEYAEVYYVAKWSNIPVEMYFADEDYMFDADTTTGAVVMSANGGTMLFEQTDGNQIDSPTYTYWLSEGDTLQTKMAEESWDTFIAAEKEGAVFSGWTVYKGTSIAWSSEPEGEDDLEGTVYFEYDNRYEGFEYLAVENCELYSEHLSTEELITIVNDSVCYYAIANWE